MILFTSDKIGEATVRALSALFSRLNQFLLDRPSIPFMRVVIEQSFRR